MCKACGYQCCDWNGMYACGCDDCVKSSCYDIDYLEDFEDEADDELEEAYQEQ